MKPFVWNPDMSIEEVKDGAYWERNVMALMCGIKANEAYEQFNNYLRLTGSTAYKMDPPCGWYKHVGEEFEGWSRVISLYDGTITFHVPDSFDLGNKLPEILPNWDGHTTKEKWNKVLYSVGVKDSVEFFFIRNSDKKYLAVSTYYHYHKTNWSPDIQSGKPFPNKFSAIDRCSFRDGEEVVKVRVKRNKSGKDPSFEVLKVISK